MSLTAQVPAPARAAFDVCGPLPTGTTVLEASAGTGKTYAIAALAARYVAEQGVSIRELLLVTFGRMATTELRTRVRERLVLLLADLDAPSGHLPTDEVAALLCDVPDDVRELRRDRVATALRDFDEATIATTHEFCLSMLESLGVLGDAEPGAQFVERVDDLVDETASDVYLQRYASAERTPMTLSEAQRLARRACDASTARLVPAASDLAGAGGTRDADARERVGFADAVRTEVEARMRAGQLFTYDDMLTRLAGSLSDPERGPAAAQRLRDAYEVVLVDEFQDTDPVQWDVLRTSFAGHVTMVLIGDPKQAIYGFRGADVHCYLDARDLPGTTVSTLPTNYRSDADLLAAFDVLLGGASLGDRGIVVEPVRAARPARRLLPGNASDGAGAPVRLRVWQRAEGDDSKPPAIASVRTKVLADLVADVTGLLASGARLHLDGSVRPVGPGDVAVLVRTNNSAEAVRAALVAAGVPTVVHAARSVFASDAAQDWRTLLTAIDAPRQAHVRAATLTCFFGWSVADLAGADDDTMIEVAQQVRGWRRALQTRGVAALVEALTRDRGVPERLLSQVGGSRLLTDLRHLAESLHQAATLHQLGPGALLEWLDERIAEARDDQAAEGSRRLETDGKTVTVVTVHRAKGLQYPVVYLPDAFDRYVPDDDGGTLLLHPDDQGTSTADPARPTLDLDVGGRWAPGRVGRFRRYQSEQASEDLRLLYVALTRAQCQVVTWWAPTRNTACSALQRVLRRDPTGTPAAAYPLTDGDPSTGRDLGPHVRLETLDPEQPRTPVPYAAGRDADVALAVRTFDRALDLAWRRTSYSALTAAAHGLDLGVPAVGSEPDTAREDDETRLEAEGPSAGSPTTGEPGPSGAAWDAVSPMAGLPSGTDFGTAVHAVLEEIDPAGPELAGAMRAACAAVLARTGGTTMSPDALAAGLLPALATPLGPLVGDRTLSEIPRRDRLAELAFELPLAGGDRPVPGELRLGAVAPLLRRHLAPGDPLTPYADRLASPVLADQSLRGYLTGSIDAVLRVRDEDGATRHLVVDYKTNWLGPFDGRPLTLEPYAPGALAAAMMVAHYPLQALLYCVAVHRMLRWRQPGYDPDAHLGGVLYLFVRGMAGPGTPREGDVPAGVFSWRPPTGLVLDLSDLLAGRPQTVSR